MNTCLADTTKLNKKRSPRDLKIDSKSFDQLSFFVPDSRYIHSNTEKVQGSGQAKPSFDKEYKKNSDGKYHVQNDLTYDLSQSSGSDLVYNKLSLFYENFELLKGLQFIGLFKKCMWKLSKESKVKVIGDYIDLSEFRRCNHQNCPVCSIRISLPKRHKINRLVEINKYHQTGSVLFLTLTGYHYSIFDMDKHFEIMQKSLSNLLDSSDWNYDRTSVKHKSFRPMKSIKSVLGVDFMYVAHDYTYSENYGHHNHFHIMVCCNSQLDAEQVSQIESRIKYLWQDIYSKNTKEYYKQGSAYNKAFKKHAVMLLDSTNDYKKVSRYLTNELPLSKELTAVNGKQTKLETSHNLRNLYKMLLDDDPQIPRNKLVAIVHSYIRSTNKKRLGKFVGLSDRVAEEIKDLNVDMKQSRKLFIESNQKKFSQMKDELVPEPSFNLSQLMIQLNTIVMNLVKETSNTIKDFDFNVDNDSYDCYFHDDHTLSDKKIVLSPDRKYKKRFTTFYQKILDSS